MFSRFGDLSNEKDIGLQISGMKAEIEKEFGPHYEIISQFDEVDKRFEDSMEESIYCNSLRKFIK